MQYIISLLLLTSQAFATEVNIYDVGNNKSIIILIYNGTVYKLIIDNNKIDDKIIDKWTDNILKENEK